MKRLIAAGLALTLLSGCGTISASRERQVPSKNHRLCGIDGTTALADGVLFLFGGFPGIAAFAIDTVTGGLWLSDKECTARGY